MLYTQYKDAALKHLQACKTALHGLSGTVSTTNKDALLLDIFYLSGYTLECIINYAIYKRVGWHTNVYDLIDSNNKISFYKPKKDRNGNFIRIFDTRTNQHFTPQYWIAQHQFNRNIRLLADIFRVEFPGTSFHLVNNLTRVSMSNQKMILEIIGNGRTRNNQDFWKPELRYEPVSWFNARYTEQDVIDLVNLTEQVFIQLQSV